MVERSMLGVGTFFFVLVLKRRASRGPLHTGLDSACEWCMVLRVGHETAQAVAAKRVSDTAAVSGGRWQSGFFFVIVAFIFPAYRSIYFSGLSAIWQRDVGQKTRADPGAVAVLAGQRLSVRVF